MRRGCAASRIVEVLEHVSAEQRFETPWRDARQIGRVGIGREGLDGEAAGAGVRHRMGIDLEAGRAGRQHRQQITGAAAEVERRSAAQPLMTAEIELPYDATQSAARDLPLEIDGVKGQ
jgi:hypothetical protein